jgi:hypothetical protein
MVGLGLEAANRDSRQAGMLEQARCAVYRRVMCTNRARRAADPGHKRKPANPQADAPA